MFPSLSEFLGRKTPRQLQRIIRQHNEKMFNVFIEFPKPIIAAVNGPGIGSGTTAPALCDTILASSTAIFLAPFARLVKLDWCQRCFRQRDFLRGRRSLVSSR